MARLAVLVVLFLWETVGAKYVRPNRPFFDTYGFPRRQFDEQTSLAEMKRMFESLDQMSAPSNSAEDEPIAWYEPQEDEQFEDKGKCVDNFSKCQVFVENKQCYEQKYRRWMQSKCRKTCGFCEESCWESKYGCCPDFKTNADGPGKAGCGVKLCVDLRDCEGIKKEQCDSPDIGSAKKVWFENNCAYTCRRCKAPNPKAECETRQAIYGCCWNGQEATGWNGQGCLPCEDVYPRACQLFSACDSPFYNVRSFLDINCPKTCGRCGSCIDKQKTAKCEQWERQGLCTSPESWKTYMEEQCAKTCRFCESSGHVGVRSFFLL